MTWYCIEIIYNDFDNGTMIYRRKNLTGDEVMKFRENVYKAGLFVPNKDHPATEGVIISPWEIKKMSSYMQSKKFE